MFHDESNRGNHSPLTRRSIPNKYGDNKSRPYQSPGYQYGGYNSGQQHNNGGLRRRPDSGSNNPNTNNRTRQFNPLDRVVKQNDIIIRLLTEIRDRLPAAPRTQAAQQPQSDAAEHPASVSDEPAQQDESVFDVSASVDKVTEEAAADFEAEGEREEDNFNC
ncbi:MAG: hypothetical protein LBI42_03440 [Chitinispirillales bacterium]|nr:hypothetical protein [Chitinispirillales bacterium]